ncbi:PREDICTED: uncharacterized protein LOC107337057 [Acropora digitifera]|uniref:uncharacterized protein LOC107337057 n=1 Tax=Acropora digitifera TaxID=70779 RepID=UPI00077ABEC0|nr:PREDICTED: uncharacterized protein LOC107337057 [Acropora digitifera]
MLIDEQALTFSVSLSISSRRTCHTTEHHGYNHKWSCYSEICCWGSCAYLSLCVVVKSRFLKQNFAVHFFKMISSIFTWIFSVKFSTCSNVRQCYLAIIHLYIILVSFNFTCFCVYHVLIVTVITFLFIEL